jgi:type IV pilus assembly protein PilA
MYILFVINYQKVMKNKGFTLIELLVVVAIIGILAAVGVVAFSGFSNSAKVKTTLFNHTQAVKNMKTLLFACETAGSVRLKIDSNGSESNFACSTGADNLKVQFTAHFFWSGFRNVWDTETCCAVAGDSRMKGYMIGYSCNNNGAMGFTLICNESLTRMWMETNLGPTIGCSGCATTTERVYIDIPR